MASPTVAAPLAPPARQVGRRVPSWAKWCGAAGLLFAVVLTSFGAEAPKDEDARLMKKFIDVATETVFGALWTRPGLDLKTRALICVVSDVATGREPELGLHLRMARRQGWTEEGLTEVLLHLSGYVGVPITRESMMVASKVFAEFRAEQAAEKPARA